MALAEYHTPGYKRDNRRAVLSIVPESSDTPQREKPAPNLPMTGMLHFNLSGDQFGLSPTIRAARIAQLSQASGVQPWDTGLAFINNESLVAQVAARPTRSSKTPIVREGAYWTREGAKAQKAKAEEAVRVLASEVFSLADTFVALDKEKLNEIISQYKNEDDGHGKMIGEDALLANALEAAGGLRLGREDLYQPVVLVSVEAAHPGGLVRPEDDLNLDDRRRFGQPREVSRSEEHMSEKRFVVPGLKVVYIARNPVLERV